MSHSSSPGQSRNRLAHESSPYLLQHASNPVDWFPWNEEAFEKARREDKPIFLSIGYSACHWCHVMERESFENEEIAEILNQNFVSIKVDREERPDLDQIYMSAVQLITRRGGWPMSVFMTPDGHPFYGGTYWPPVSRMGMPGFKDILLKLTDYWKHKRDEVESSAQQLSVAIQDLAAPIFENVPLSEETLQKAMMQLIGSADRKNGGFGVAPKFPHPMDLRVLMRAWQRFESREAKTALETARFTLTKMAQGGIYDQLGGGFHRYSTDAYWLVPHFEKMLYDNALLVPAYLEMFQITREPLFARVARETLDYVLREMTSPEGGFYSTQDADSEGVEGKFFVWSEAEIVGVLGRDDAEIFNAVYDVSARGNWEGHNILNLPRSIPEMAEHLAIPLPELEATLHRCREKLLSARSRRIHPGRDEKILCSWNGMMISALAMAAGVLDEPRYCAAAEKAVQFLLTRLRDDAGRLRHSFQGGEARFQAYLDDYACLIDGLVELFQVTGVESHLESALELTQQAFEHFRDDGGGFFYTANDHEQLIARIKDSQDNATPSGNGMMATALAKLARMTGRRDLEEEAIMTLASLSALMSEHPRAAGQSLLALDFMLGPGCELVYIDQNDEESHQIKNEVWKPFLPRKVVIPSRTGHPIPEALKELMQGKTESQRVRLYICRQQGHCEHPAESASEATERLALLAQEVD